MTWVQSCPFGLTRADLEATLGGDLDRFDQWFVGQTGSICDGREFDHSVRLYHPSVCAEHPHGFVVYPWDVRQFLRGGDDLEWANRIGSAGSNYE